MKLSFEILTSVGVTAELLSGFGLQADNGYVEYQATLDAFARADLPDIAATLMDSIGPDDSSCLVIDSSYDAPSLVKHIFAAGDLEIHGDCHLTGWIRAGSHIRSSACISATQGLIAG